MNRNDIFRKTEEICRDVFEDETLQVTEESTAEDVEGWDSLSHLTLISEMEAAFGITFTLEEVTGSRNLGDLVSAVERHAAGK